MEKTKKRTFFSANFPFFITKMPFGVSLKAAKWQHFRCIFMFASCFSP